ncbi:MAG: ParB/RepB/Spo0J family partition protein [Solirubrobacterales bacterium]|nr:ParB/RepB/Spo0J family partition protein [Solirubrobacterales bacterium]
MNEIDALALDTGELRELPVGLIHRNPRQPRTHFDPEKLDELAGSVGERGVLQPVLVRPFEGEFQLVAGERRWRAACKAGRATVPALIRSVDDQTALELALIENMAREDLNPIEEAKSAQALCAPPFGLSKAELARRAGCSRASLSHKVRLLELPDQVQALLEEKKLSEGHGRALLLCADHDERRRLARQAVTAGWSVRTLERAARTGAGERTTAVGRAAPKHPDQLAVAEELQDTFGRALGREVSVDPLEAGYRVSVVVADPLDAREVLDRLDSSPP